MSGRRCDTCEWFRPVPDDGEHGTCHRYPPQVMFRDDEYEEVPPMMAIDDWCGEWKAKELTPPADPLS